MEKVLISDLIEELKRLQIEHGDIECKMEDQISGLSNAWPVFNKDYKKILFFWN